MEAVICPLYKSRSVNILKNLHNREKRITASGQDLRFAKNGRNLSDISQFLAC